MQNVFPFSGSKSEQQTINYFTIRMSNYIFKEKVKFSAPQLNKPFIGSVGLPLKTVGKAYQKIS